MKKLLLSLAALTLLATPALANHTPEHASVHSIRVQVNGLVCDFCARAVEKVFYKQDGVEGVNVNLDDHIVTLDIQDGKDLDDALITQLITDAGYNLVEIKREE